MNPRRPEWARAKRLALRRRSELGLTVPTDVTKVARALGLKLLYMEIPSSGMLIRRDGMEAIVVRASDSPARQRFTIAHECGHAELHPPQATYDHRRDERSTLGSDKEEVEANAYAAHLLMPELELRSRLDGPLDPHWDGARVEALAETFGVSVVAMTTRLGTLGLLHGRGSS